MGKITMEEQSQEKEVTIKLSKSGLWQIISGILGVLLIISIFTGGFGFGSTSSNTPTGGTVVNRGSGAPTGVVEVSADDDPVLGNSNAPVTIIEFSDYQCPFCRKFWTDTLPQIKTNYIDTGKVKLVYRDFPLDSIHPMAQKSAEAAQCVFNIGGNDKYWEFHDKIFKEQNKLDSGSEQGPVKGTVQYTINDLKKWAKDIGVDETKFNKCLDDGKFASEVASDFQDGVQAGVQGTPAFFVNGKLISGAQPYSVFQAAIDAEL